MHVLNLCNGGVGIRGRFVMVDGLRHKRLAATRAGARRVLCPLENKIEQELGVLDFDDDDDDDEEQQDDGTKNDGTASPVPAPCVYVDDLTGLVEHAFAPQKDKEGSTEGRSVAFASVDRRFSL